MIDIVHVLVDYDNLLPNFKSLHPELLASELLHTMSLPFLQGYDRINIRLYGGWYSTTSMTQRAQLLASKLHPPAFPKHMNLVLPQATTKFTVNVELAHALKVEPARTVMHTYRTNRRATGVQAHPPQKFSCSSPECPLPAIHKFISTASCHVPGCSVTCAEVLFKNEQKLVDTMIATDLIYLALTGESPICIVSSDDDLWPPIRLALTYKRKILHLHTRSTHLTPDVYTRNIGPNYIQAHLETKNASA